MDQLWNEPGRQMNREWLEPLIPRVALLLMLAGAFGCSDRPAQPHSALPAQTSDATRVTTPAAAQAPEEMAAAITVRAPDAFYDPPANPPRMPGTLIRSEPLKDVILPPGVRGWRILYTTTIDDRTPATAAATVFAPERSTGSHPLVIWEHGTTGALQRCMPSLVSAPGLGIPALEQAVGNGWVIVATDYSFAEKDGPHPYLIGEGEARAALDSARAVRQMSQVKLDARAVVWGHSQGGHAALWTGIIGPRYAPDIELAGVAAVAPAADVAAILSLNPAADKLLGPYVALSYSRFYPDVSFKQALRSVAVAAGAEMAKLCGVLPPQEPARLRTLAESFVGRALAVDTNAAFMARLKENAATQPIGAPLLIAQGAADTVVPAAVIDRYVDARCRAGQRLEYWRFAGRDHMGVVQANSPLIGKMMTWTKARFAGEPQPTGCKRTSL